MKQRFPLLPPKLGSLIVSVAFLSLTPSVPVLGVAAEVPTAGPLAAPIRSLAVEVETDPAIPDASTLSAWIQQESLDALAKLELSSNHRGTIRVSVSGALYEYRVSITTILEGSTEEKSTEWSCECSNDDLLTRIRADVQTAATALDEQIVAPDHDDIGADEKSSPSSPVVTRAPTVPLRELQLRGKVGLGLMVGGSAGVLSGIVLMGVGVRSHEYNENSAKLVYNDYRVPGVPTFLVGASLLAAGATFLVFERRRARLQRDVAWMPHVTSGRRDIILGLTKRF